KQSGLILDIDDRDVSALFTKLPPQLRYLAVIGCHTEKHLQNLLQKGRFPEDLKLFASPHKVSPLAGSRRALAASYEALGTNKPYRLEPVTGTRIRQMVFPTMNARPDFRQEGDSQLSPSTTFWIE